MEGQKEKYYLLREQLSQQFNPRQWKKISSQTSQQFLTHQQHIFNKLMKNKQLYQKYFEKFYKNHIRIADWFLLATKQKQQIKQYMFRPLLSHHMTFYNEKIKEAFLSKEKQIDQKDVYNSNEIKAFQQQLMKEFFQNILDKNQKQHLNKPLNLKLYTRSNNNKNTKEMDDHEFYLKTFDACNGWKYIYYDYQKHMKGMKERFKYNAFLRVKKGSKIFNMNNQNDSSLKKYEEFEKAKTDEKCSLLAFNMVLNNDKVNTQKGYRSLMKQNKSNKIVFVNHQGKPVTYKLAPCIH